MRDYPMTAADAVAFQNALRTAYGRFDTAPLAASLNSRASGQVNRVDCPAMAGFEIRASQISSRRPALDGQWQDSAFILMILDGAVELDHHSRQTTLTAGDMALLDGQESCRIDVPDRAHALTLKLYRPDVMALRPCVSHLFAVPMPGKRAISRVLSGTIRTVIEEECHDTQEITAIRSAVLTLVDQALTNDDPSLQCSERERLLLSRIREWVIANPEKVEAGLHSLAEQFGMSRRSLYRLFGRLGTSPTRWITDVRLEHAYHWLSGRQGHPETVTSVALASGFSDSSHFSRVFKRRFGVAPSACRSASQAQSQVAMR